MNKLEEILRFSPEVQRALDSGKPVVSLESTDIARNMPYPQNVETALRVADIVRENGAVPAAIAVLGGKLCIGLSKEEIEGLGKKGLDVPKASRRDIPVLAARGQDGATTVAATMVLSALAGIGVFSTGAIGGVQRSGVSSMDVSADLDELGRTSTLVVCGGVNSGLDIARTLEYLETKGVPVIGYRTDELPAFYTNKSGCSVSYRFDSPADIAHVFSLQESLGMHCGMLVANPVPDGYSIDPGIISQAIQAATSEADQSGVPSKDLTRFLLDRLFHNTCGKSLESNIQLLYSNAALAAKIAVAL